MSACGDFVSIEAFDELPALAELAYGSVQPAVPYDYWELRESLPGGMQNTPGGGGTLRKDDISPNLRSAFDGTTALSGFGPFCPAGNCYRYFATLRGQTVETWEDGERAAAFLGTIDNMVEAALLALANGYHWGPTKEAGAIRPTADGYELVALKTVSSCNPIQTDRFLLHISQSGSITVLKSEPWHSERACA